MESLKNVAEIVKLLQNTSGTNYKMEILKANKDNELLKSVLYYTLNPYLKYKITEDVYDKTEYDMFNFEVRTETFFELLEKLSETNINNSSRCYIKSAIETNEDVDVRELYKMILFKDLKCGLAAKSVNKVFKGLIPTFDVMLAESFAKQKDGFLKGKRFSITEKLDGCRITYIPSSQEFISRQGQKYEGIDHLISECEQLSQGKYVLDGELIYRNYDNLPSDELYRLTMSVSRKKGNTPQKKHLEFHVFDIIPLNEFSTGESIMRYEERMSLLNNVFENAFELDFVVRVPILYSGSDESVIPKLLSEVTSDGKEGLMINLNHGKYQCKRSKNILKVKKFEVCDCFVTDVYEGSGVLSGTLGGINVKFKYNDKLYECGVGSGFTYEQRQKYWNNPELLIGKVVEVQYFEVSNNRNGSYGLRFPVFKDRIRDDKTYDDITDVKTN